MPALQAIILLRWTGSPAASLVNTQRVALRADSDAAFDTVHQWLSYCGNNHPSCPILPAGQLKYMSSSKDLQNARSPLENTLKLSKEVDGPKVLPTRVLDVGPPDGSQESFLCVFEKQIFGFWLALSHCWGTVPLLRTTTKTIGEHIKGIPSACHRRFEMQSSSPADSVFDIFGLTHYASFRMIPKTGRLSPRK